MSDLEATLALQIILAGLPEPELEYRFHPERKWRFDFAWPDLLIAAEVEGGVWTQGRHSRGGGFINDCRKYNSAAELDWLVFRFPAALIESGEAIAVLSRVFGLSTLEGVG